MINTLLQASNGTTEDLLGLLGAYEKAINFNIISSITDTQGTILYANDRFCEVSQYSAAELVGQKHSIINSGYHPPAFFSHMWQTIKAGNPWHDDIRNKAKDGSFYWVDTVILPMRDSKGNINRYLSLRTLITDKKEAEEQKKEYMEKLSEMLHMTSHRVRRPLATCLGLMNLVEDPALSDDEFKDIIGHIKSSAMELDDFTKELTGFIHELEKKYNPGNQIRA